MREVGVEVVVGRDDALGHEPGAVLLLRAQQKLHALLVDRIGDRETSGDAQRIECLSRAIGVTLGLAWLGQATIRALCSLQRVDGLAPLYHARSGQLQADQAKR